MNILDTIKKLEELEIKSLESGVFGKTPEDNIYDSAVDESLPDLLQCLKEAIEVIKKSGCNCYQYKHGSCYLPHCDFQKKWCGTEGLGDSEKGEKE